MKREEKHGEKAWEESKKIRIACGIFETIVLINNFLWILVPVDSLQWQIAESYVTLIILAVVLSTPFLIIMVKGMMDAGKETMEPSKDTEMYGGIYKYIRHPQSLGEFPLFVTFAILTNSWFMVILSALLVIIYVPIMVKIEEEDLIKRFGESYKEYQKKTGALLPKFHTKK